jgi:hypothetical protein
VIAILGQEMSGEASVNLIKKSECPALDSDPWLEMSAEPRASLPKNRECPALIFSTTNCFVLLMC